MDIRTEKPEDLATVRNVNIVAFGRENEANLVDRLRGIASTFSLVAVQSDRVVGHIFFSPVVIAGECSSTLSILGLAPVAVLSNYQRQGIGSLLIREGLKQCARSHFQAVVVLGSPDFYSRFGFVPASSKMLRCEYDVPDEAFMVLELERGALQDCSGTVKYRSEFSLCE
ncbi:MAG: N-acetyltransferase [Microcoleus sp. PH2017_01_SCD_O_A]|jgi:putative acetyltransferase|uniref:GNAT family N-acetyltransferase n=1 Tax=unclassified Microcoleus TaxID=2642155 RepID=UPI001E037C63|nr:MULTISPECIES: N-acetyltransferase [unclassified Microcoleus]MCC3430991.1 N-acetyltransferase [Microcoleus sp. PH2017_04_SCI_O_A]TAE62201.1 MAG: N-acetyltransferase [Oscillatoriales cyanobacterium]MCC3427875.1 N-acetyltransferase [Microcoleus sp. PH2017_01_SCD_O_A]MCC3569191.1 N-acetyltransferase [Microcoleus sp. PH2017_31_RDM_U_A]MCC3581508.1 N-acetyltransferase [Microcoleus sp. PH2017_32_RDM_D_A]